MANNNARRNNAMQGNANQGIVKSWSLLAFAREKGHMQLGDFTNPATGEEFKACIFTDADMNRTFVGFSRNLGVLTAKQIVAQKADLQVVELESGYYSLCKQGTNSWEDVNLGI